jgi:SAM-dependent methyltransferase
MRLALTEAAIDAALADEWYYSIELTPGNFTSGRLFPNIVLTRYLLRRCHILGQRCLDIGTMEGLVPTLLARRGAREVVAVDGLNLSSRISLVQAAYEVEFDYHGNVGLTTLYDFLTERTRFRGAVGVEQSFGFDVVILSGLLYHVFSPLHVLGTVRSCVRAGGLVIVETAAVRSREYDLRFNFSGTRYIYGWTDVWFPTVALLDYLCRFVKLAPLDCVYLGPSDPGCPDIIRIGIVCRATEHVVPREAEVLMEQSTHNFEYSSLLRRQVPRGPGEEDVPYEMDKAALHGCSNVETCDLIAAVETTAPLSYSRDQLLLRLEDRT